MSLSPLKTKASRADKINTVKIQLEVRILVSMRLLDASFR